MLKCGKIIKIAMTDISKRQLWVTAII